MCDSLSSYNGSVKVVHKVLVPFDWYFKLHIEVDLIVNARMETFSAETDVQVETGDSFNIATVTTSNDGDYYCKVSLEARGEGYIHIK